MTVGPGAGGDGAPDIIPAAAYGPDAPAAPIAEGVAVEGPGGGALGLSLIHI